MVTVTRDALIRQLRNKARKYNEIVAQESYLGAEKKPLRDDIVDIMSHIGKNTVDTVGLKVSVSTRIQRSIDIKLAEKFLDAAILAKITIEKEIETLRVIPTR